MEYYSAIKRNEVRMHVTREMGLENITLSERRHLLGGYIHTECPQWEKSMERQWFSSWEGIGRRSGVRSNWVQSFFLG